MNEQQSTRRRTAVYTGLLILAVTLLTTPAYASSFEIVKTFDTPLVGTGAFSFLIEKKVFGVWVEIPCVDNAGSCTITYSDVPAGTEFVLADTDMSWFTSGDFYIKELAPPGWSLDITSAGTTLFSFNPLAREAYFSFNLETGEDGNLTLHNVGEAPEPATLALLGLGVGAVRMRRRRLSR
jgi:hypothetical protein